MVHISLQESAAYHKEQIQTKNITLKQAKQNTKNAAPYKALNIFYKLIQKESMFSVAVEEMS